MSFESLSCPRHPSDLVVGICASCLRERLFALEPSKAEGQLLCRSSTSSQHSSTCVPIKDERVEEGGIHGTGFRFRKKVLDEVNRTRFCTVSEDGSHGNILMFEGSSSMANLSEIASFDAIHIDEHVCPRRKTLWSLFNLDDAERSKAKNRVHDDIDLKRLNEVTVVNWLTQNSSDVTKASEVKPAVKHTVASNYQFPAADGRRSSMRKTADGSKTSPSWLISLFRRRMRAGSKQKGGKTFCLVGKADAWEEARSSWDETKACSWERTRTSSSFLSEGARPSWESTRPSWDGANSDFSLLAPCLETVSEAGATSERVRKGRQETFARKGALRSSGAGGAQAAISYSLIVPDSNQKEMVVNIAATSSVCGDQRDAGTQTRPAENEQTPDHVGGGGGGGRSWSKLAWSKPLVTPSPMRAKQRRRAAGGEPAGGGGWLKFYLTPLRSGSYGNGGR